MGRSVTGSGASIRGLVEAVCWQAWPGKAGVGWWGEGEIGCRPYRSRPRSLSRRLFKTRPTHFGVIGPLIFWAGLSGEFRRQYVLARNCVYGGRGAVSRSGGWDGCFRGDALGGGSAAEGEAILARWFETVGIPSLYPLVYSGGRW
jgi:hypothetical protein